MADWQFRLEFGSFWHQDFPPAYVANEVVIRLRELLPKIQRRRGEDYQELAEELELNIIPAFEEVAEDETATSYDEFNYALSDLYDWGDTPLDNRFGGKKMCWVDTFRPAAKG